MFISNCSRRSANLRSQIPQKWRGKIRWPSMSSHRIFPYPFWTIPEPLVPDIIPVYFISFLRLATEQHSTLPQKGGINGKVYLLNKMNNFTSSRPTLWLKSSRNCSGGWRGLVGGFSYYIKIFYQIYFIKIYIWKRGKPKSAKHRRILMPIWFHSLTILPGSAAGAAALKFGSAGSTRVACPTSVPERLELYGEARPKPPTLRRRAPKNTKNPSGGWGKAFWTESGSLISVSKSILPPPPFWGYLKSGKSAVLTHFSDDFSLFESHKML